MASKFCLACRFPEKHLPGAQTEGAARKRSQTSVSRVHQLWHREEPQLSRCSTEGWTHARGALQIYKGVPVPQVCTMRNQLFSQGSALLSGQGPPRGFHGDHLLLPSLCSHPYPPPPLTPFAGTHIHTPFPQSMGSGFYSNKATANQA